jgi:LL-diaminopimelate aminotransferase
VRAFADTKDNFDSGQFIAIQKAAASALDDPEIPKRTRTKYRRRMEKLVATLGRCGFKCQMPGGTYFLYTPSPKGFANGAAGGGPVNFENAEAASQYLITEQSICTVPWDDAGAFLRFSVTYEAADEKAEDALMAETESRIKNLKPVF